MNIVSEGVDLLNNCSSYFFCADDLASILTGRIGVKFSEQSIYLEKRL